MFTFSIKANTVLRREGGLDGSLYGLSTLNIYHHYTPQSPYSRKENIAVYCGFEATTPTIRMVAGQSSK
jgi:hypothetical protein